MKMELRRNSWIVRWAYLFEYRRVWVRQTSICALFWRTVLLTPLKIAVPSSVLVMLAFVAYTHPWNFLKALLLIGVIGLTTAAIVGIVEAADSGSIQRSLVGRGITAIKDRYCPIVSIEGITR